MDDIQQKLKLIDEQLAAGKNFFKQIINTSPLLICTLGLITGIILQNKFNLPAVIWLLSLGLCITAGFFLIIRQGG